MDYRSVNTIKVPGDVVSTVVKGQYGGLHIERSQVRIPSAEFDTSSIGVKRKLFILNIPLFVQISNLIHVIFQTIVGIFSPLNQPVYVIFF